VELSGAGTILILTKAEPEEGNTGYAQGGIAAAVGDDDSPGLHLQDTLAAGDGLCDPEAVRALVEDGPRYVQELLEWGVQFDRGANGRPALAIEGAHSARRVLHARDATGREIGRVLWKRASTLPGVTALPHARVVDLLVEDGACRGACYIDADGRLIEARAEMVLLATGGAGQVYRETTNPLVATGDGVAMGYRAGAAVADLEFVQFHPTALKVAGQPRFLLSEALRGEGARLINRHGESFVSRYESAGDLASRDRVSRAIAREESRTGGPVSLSLQQLDASYVHSRFPLIAEACARAGLDLARDPIPVGPAAHYIMGGVLTDVDGRTTLPGLYAAGEVACTGVHGANRLASNSLLEGLVFGARSARAMKRREGPFHAETARGLTVLRDTPAEGPASTSDTDIDVDASVRDLMWESVGLFRTAAALHAAVARLEPRYRTLQRQLERDRTLDVAGWRTVNLVTLARLIARAALRREESRGAHYRDDFPARDDIHWGRRIADVRLASP
jgi:L-aspartate oxidase